MSGFARGRVKSFGGTLWLNIKNMSGSKSWLVVGKGKQNALKNVFAKQKLKRKRKDSANMAPLGLTPGICVLSTKVPGKA